MNRWKINSPFHELQTFAAGAAIGAVGAGVGLWSATQQADAASDAASAMDDATAAQMYIARRQMDLADEQWNLYKENIYPLELESQRMGISAQQLALERGQWDHGLYRDYYMPLAKSFVKDAETGIEPQYDRVSREARVQVDKAYDQAEGQVQRGMERRGVKPGTGSYRAGMGDITLNRAATKALGVQEAVDRERDRVENTNFNRKAVALGRQPLAANPIQSAPSGIGPNAATAGFRGAGYTAGSAAQNLGTQANMYGNNAGGAFNSAIQLGMGAYDIFNRYRQPGPTMNPTGSTSYSPNFASSNPWANPAIGGPQALAEGGPVMPPGQPPGYAGGGPMQAPALVRGEYQGGATVQGPGGVDQVPGSVTGPGGETGPVRLTAGEYVIPADVVQAVGTDPLDEIIAKSRERKMQAAGPQSTALVRRG